jgi:siroheme decarboxylase
MTKSLDNNIRYDVFHNTSYTPLEKKLLNDFQHDFPLSSQPFNEIAERLNVDLELVIKVYEKLHADGVISRIGPVIKPNIIGTSLLAALSVPEEELLDVANMVNSYAEVNHNYEREHEFNLWFVITAKNNDRLEFILDEIQGRTACPLLRLPLEDAYHIDLGFELKWNQH